MTYLELIDNNLRPFVDDFKILTRDSWNGDASTLAFRTTNRPILEESFTVKVSDVAQIENTNYTINRKTGMVSFVSGSVPAAGDDNVTMDYEYVKIDDTDWLEIIKNVIRMWRKKMWTDAINETTLSTVVNQNDYDLAGISTRIEQVIYVQYRSSSNVEWVDMGRDTNVRFMKEQNKINVRPYFQVAGYEMRIRYLEFYNDNVALGDTILWDDKFIPAFQYACAKEFMDRFIAKMLSETGMKVTKETYETVNTMRGIRNDWQKEGEKQISRVKPLKPSVAIPTIIQGVKT